MIARFHHVLAALICCTSVAHAAGPATQPARIGPSADIGCRENPRRVASLLIDKPGVYENILVDAEWGDHDAVRIKADGVTLRNCEVRNARRDGIEVYANNVTIENCRIHHLLSGSFTDQKDAHGITGRPTRLVVRNCEIGYMSGDCLQFDPGRGAWTDVTIENCRLFTGPLPADAGDFKKGQQPGENGVDTKQAAGNPRSRITVRNCIIEGFAANGQISNAAGLNLKENVEATVENCAFLDNEICLRLRGPGKNGGAKATVIDCYFYNSLVAFRTEDGITGVLVTRPKFGEGVQRQVRAVGAKEDSVRLTDPAKAPPAAELLGRAQR